MPIQLKPLEEQTLVITGASSGIGLATALEAARRGARLVLASRDPAGLEEAAEQCRAEGAGVETVVADVAERAAMDRVAERATERFGGFDTWVNNAGVSVYGEIKDVPLDDARGVFETNYWGVVHGSLVAAEHARGRSGEYGLALINVGSVLSDRAIPLQGYYSASKHAVKGFTDALRMELEKEGLPVSVTLVKPNATDTPYPEHAGNYMAEEASLPEPTYAPEVVARAILSAAERPVRDVTVGAKDGLLAALGTILPGVTDKIMEALMFDQQKEDARFSGDRQGTIFEPDAGNGRVHGDADHVLQSSLYTQAQLHPLLTAGAAVGAGLALFALARR